MGMAAWHYKFHTTGRIANPLTWALRDCVRTGMGDGLVPPKLKKDGCDGAHCCEV